MRAGSTAALGFYFASRTGFVIQRIGVLHVSCPAADTHGEVQLVVIRNALQKVPGPLEIQARVVVQQEVGFIGTADAVAVLDAWPWPAGRNAVLGVQP
jgi:hypothetical protein